MQGQLDEWIADLPAEWDTVKTKQLFRILRRQVPHKGQTILSITQQGIRPKNISENAGQMAGTYDGYQEVFVGDFAMNSMDLLTGWVDQSQYDGLTSPDYRVFAPIEPSCVHGPFYSYVFQSLYTRRVYYKYGQGVSNMGRWRLPAQTFLNFPLPHPAIEEQRIIAKFIESKTSEIDALVEKLVRQVELLERYRRELIARTVTRGLNPDVPMRDSGIQWLARIPSHWEVLTGKRIFTKLRRQVMTGAETVTCFRDGTVTLRRNRRTEGFTESLQEIGYQGVEVGDLVIHEMDAFAGAIGVSDSAGKSTPVYSVCGVQNGGSPNFYAYLLRHMAGSGYIEALARGIRQRSVDFRFRTLASLSIAVPPVSEQRNIADFLDRKSEEISSTIAGINRQIELMREYRKQVINDAVTGRVRVGEVA